MGTDVSPEAHGRCGAKTRSGGACKQRAGAGTDHLGSGRCKFHGGKSPIRHGRYSAIQRQDLSDAIQRFEADPDPLNLLPELATLRALLEGYVNRYDEMVEALLEWNAEFATGEGAVKPQRIPALESVGKLLSEVTKVVKRIEDIRAQNAVSRPALFRILREMGNVVRRHNDIEEPSERLKAIEDDWGRISL